MAVSIFCILTDTSSLKSSRVNWARFGWGSGTKPCQNMYKLCIEPKIAAVIWCKKDALPCCSNLCITENAVMHTVQHSSPRDLVCWWNSIWRLSKLHKNSCISCCLLNAASVRQTGLRPQLDRFIAIFSEITHTKFNLMKQFGFFFSW